MIQRLIISYIRYDRASIAVFRAGLVAKAPQSGVAKLQIEHSEMRQADADGTTAEMELGITPRCRGKFRDCVFFGAVSLARKDIDAALALTEDLENVTDVAEITRLLILELAT